MKFLKKLLSTLLFLFLISVAVLTIFWFAGGQQTIQQFYQHTVQSIAGKASNKEMDDPRNDSVLEHSKRHADPNYVCPMHPQIVKGEPGNCPICGMDLVKKEVSKPKQTKQTNKKIKYWVAPMDANYRRDKPGKSPMGMDLVPVYESSDDDMGEDEFPIISIDASTAQNMGIRVETAKINKLSRTIKTIGTVAYNEDTLQHIHTRTSGWVERVYTQSLGDPVSKGKTLLEYYSPDILSAQKDLLSARRVGSALSGRGTSLMESSRIRLRDLNVPKNIINQVLKSGKSQKRIPVIANNNGVITRVGIRNGMYITPTTELYTIADLSSVWVLVDVFEHQLTWIKKGNKAEIQVQGVPGKTWKGMVDYIYPELNPLTRTLKVRLKFDSPKQLLKPNMFADVTLFNNPKRVITVPSESVIYYENKSRVVKVVSDDGKSKKYQPVEIKTGMKSEGQVEILEGINDGDKILVSGQFMIDSESNLQASFRRLSGE